MAYTTHLNVTSTLSHSYFWIFWVFFAQIRGFWIFLNLETWKTHSSERTEQRDKSWATCYPYTIGKRQLVERYLVFVADAKLLTCIVTCEPAFSECSKSWSRESLTLQRLSSSTLLGPVEVEVDCLHRVLRRWVPPSTSSIFDIS